MIQREMGGHAAGAVVRWARGYLFPDIDSWLGSCTQNSPEKRLGVSRNTVFRKGSFFWVIGKTIIAIVAAEIMACLLNSALLSSLATGSDPQQQGHPWYR